MALYRYAVSAEAKFAEGFEGHGRSEGGHVAELRDVMTKLLQQSQRAVPCYRRGRELEQGQSDRIRRRDYMDIQVGVVPERARSAERRSDSWKAAA